MSAVLTAGASPAAEVGGAPGSVPVAERIATLDILRGFALMGILIMNMPGFNSSWFGEADGSHMWSGRVDQIAEQLRDALFSGKFNGMFSMLFGLGFTIQFGRMQRQDQAHATGLYLRRLIVLLLLGLVHACVFWPGDILHMYAVLGLVMVFGLRHASNRVLVALFVFAVVIYPPVSGALRLALTSPEMVAARIAEAKALHLASVAAYGQGSFADTMAMSTRTMALGFRDGWSLWGMFGSYLSIAATMLIGMVAGRMNWVARIPELMPRIKRLMWWALFVGLACAAAFTLIFEFNRTPGPSAIKIVGGTCYRISRIALMLFYVLALVRLAQLPAWQRWLSPFAATGRMPLTNYLMQTLICITLFYHWGLGFWGQMGPAVGLLLSLALFFVVQVPWSLWWLKRHERGPMEALWARLTYGRGGKSGALAKTA